MGKRKTKEVQNDAGDKNTDGDRRPVINLITCKIEQLIYDVRCVQRTFKSGHVSPYVGPSVIFFLRKR